MVHSTVPDRSQIHRIAVVAAVASMLLLMAVLIGGCSKPATSQSAAPMKPAKETMGSKKMMATDTSRPDVPACYECSGKGKPPVVEGAATIHGATQVVNVKIENGYYSPNKITAAAGTPIQVIFAGTTKDCVGKPKFGSLNKQIDIRESGTGSIDLGTLSAGTYGFTCGMGATAGSITVQ